MGQEFEHYLVEEGGGLLYSGSHKAAISVSWAVFLSGDSTMEESTSKLTLVVVEEFIFLLLWDFWKLAKDKERMRDTERQTNGGRERF